MNIWKIETWQVPSTNRTAPAITIAGFRITYADGVIAVENNNDTPIVLLISYFDNEGKERPFLKDNISSRIIREKGATMGLTGTELDQFVWSTMNLIITYAIGGETKEERYSTISNLAQMYGHTLLPIEAQDGNIETAPNQAPA